MALGAVLLMLASAGGSYAFWSSTVAMSGGKISAADFQVNMTDGGLGSDSVDMPEVLDATVGDTRSRPLFPGDSRMRKIILKTKGETAIRGPLKVTVMGPSELFKRDDYYKKNQQDQIPLDNIEFAVKQAPNRFSCQYDEDYVQITKDPKSSLSFLLFSNGPLELCFRLTLSEDASSVVRDSYISTTVRLQVDQIPPK